jgi:hypothetical protein
VQRTPTYDAINRLAEAKPIRRAQVSRGHVRAFKGTHARLSAMPLIVILIILLVLFGGGGYYMGPGIGYYGGGGVSLLLALIVIYLLFGRGRGRL